MVDCFDVLKHLKPFRVLLPHRKDFVRVLVVDPIAGILRGGATFVVVNVAPPAFLICFLPLCIPIVASPYLAILEQ